MAGCDRVRRDAEAAVETLRRLRDAVGAGELVCSTATRYRLEGALVALEVVLGQRASLADGLGSDLPEEAP